MRFRFKIELLLAIGLLLRNFWSRPALLYNCPSTSIVYAGIFLVMLVGLVRQSSCIAILIAACGIASGLGLAVTFCCAPNHHSSASQFLLVRDEALYLVLVLGLLDLWREWRQPGNLTESDGLAS